MRTTVTPIQQAAIEKCARDGHLYPHDGVTRPTIWALEAAGLITVEWNQPTREYGSLGQVGGRKGRLVQNWVATLTPAGQLLVPGVDVTEHQPSVALMPPALFPTTDEDF